ncbi:DeoR/GlpR family DNA-binding transcription regulator [Thermicanus aegyptius]|uniref:DeoR/GlpR family DNA-binding transcription regulator n=1 Tax=Thermicanus aegyptius TaxID=94009 RepID=UPI00041CBF72|nr:DeoR/GlpR family DNA-binding transcription regulator [Thermicanus aegyptius]
MLSVDRQQIIFDQIRRKGSVRISQLMKSLAASESTIRRDLEELERQGLIKRVHGGAVLVQHMAIEASNYDKQDLFAEEKERIGKFAASLVEEHSSILIDAGTTTAALARALNTPNVKIITNALNIAEILSSKKYTVLAAGGVIKTNTYAMVGEITIETIRNFHADICFLGMNGISEETGLTTPDMQEAWVKRAMMRAAEKVVLLADSSKFGKTTLTHVGEVGEVDILVTDEGLSVEDRNWLESNGVTVFCV